MYRLADAAPLAAFWYDVIVLHQAARLSFSTQQKLRITPSSGLPATFSPLSGGEGTSTKLKKLPLEIVDSVASSVGSVVKSQCTGGLTPHRSPGHELFNVRTGTHCCSG
jgi:hypothetical protein